VQQQRACRGWIAKRDIPAEEGPLIVLPEGLALGPKASAMALRKLLDKSGNIARLVVSPLLCCLPCRSHVHHRRLL
jgi:hypothetical protein